MYDNFLALLNISELFKSQVEICEVLCFFFSMKKI